MSAPEPVLAPSLDEVVAGMAKLLPETKALIRDLDEGQRLDPDFMLLEFTR